MLFSRRKFKILTLVILSIINMVIIDNYLINHKILDTVGIIKLWEWLDSNLNLNVITIKYPDNQIKSNK